jgi:hypothetical protein
MVSKIASIRRFRHALRADRNSTSCFAASVALLAPGLARRWSESESHPNEPQALTQFLVLSHIVALLSSG